MGALGFDPEDFTEDDMTVEIWDCNADPYNVFVGMETQWRYSFAGREGLDYTAVPVVMDMLGIREKRRPDVFASVRIMEREALETMAENREDG